MEALKNEYSPKDVLTSVEMRRKLDKVSMKRFENPATLFKQLAEIRNHYGSNSNCGNPFLSKISPPQFQPVFVPERVCYSVVHVDLVFLYSPVYSCRIRTDCEQMFVSFSGDIESD